MPSSPGQGAGRLFATTMALLLSPAQPHPEAALASAILSLRAPFDPVMARALVGRLALALHKAVHGGERGDDCGACRDALPLAAFLALPAMGDARARRKEDALALLDLCRAPQVPANGRAIAGAAATLALEGYRDEGAYLARLAHDLLHRTATWCDACLPVMAGESRLVPVATK